MVKPPVLGRRTKHRVLTADLINKSGNTKLAFHPLNDIEIGHARFYHHHVSTFREVELDLTHGLIRIAGVHLIGVLISPSQTRR